MDATNKKYSLVFGFALKVKTALAKKKNDTAVPNANRFAAAWFTENT